MKKIYLLSFALLSAGALTVNAQNIAINTTGAAANASAMLDVTSTISGVLVPRMTGAQKTAIASPANGLLIYQTDAPLGFWYYDAILPAWVQLGSGGGSGWSLTGNNLTGVIPTPNEWIGSINNYDWIVKTNSTQKMRVEADGDVVIGSTLAQNNRLYVIDGSAYPRTAGYFTTLGADAIALVGAGKEQGVQGYTNGPGSIGSSWAVVGINEAGAVGSSSAYGVWGDARNIPATVTGFGLYATASGTGNGYGVYGSASGTGTTNIGGYFRALGGTNNYAIRMEGSTSGTLNFSPAATTTSYSLIFPAAQGAASTFLQNNGAGVLSWAAGGGGITMSCATNNYLTKRASATDVSCSQVFDDGTNVGIGTITPYTFTDIVNDGTPVPTLTIRSTAVNPVEGGRIRFLEDPATNGFLGGYVQWDGSANKLILGVNNTVAGTASNDLPVINVDRGTQYVGIGTTTPGAPLDVQGAVAIAGPGTKQIGAWDNTAMAANVGGTVVMGGKFDAAGSYAHFGAVKGGKENATSGDYASYMAFYTRPNAVALTEQMRITSAGNVGIKCTAPQYPLHVIGNMGVVGTIFATAASVSAGVVACSDIRYKKNVSTLTNSLNQVLQLRGVNYFWKTKEFPDKQFTEAKQIGFIAQELEKVYPEVVFTDKDGYKSVDYSKLTPVLVEAIKEQQAIIEKLKQENAAQQFENNKQNERLEKLETLLNVAKK